MASPIMPPIIWPESSPIICARTSGARAAHVAARANAQAAAIRLSLGFRFGLISTRNRHQPDSRTMTPSRRLTFASGLTRVNKVFAASQCHISKRYPVPPLETRGVKIYETNLRYYLAALAATALFGGLVHAVLVAAHVSEPAAITVYGLTPRRLWATTVAVLALVGVVIGGLALARPASRFGTDSGRLGAIVVLVAGLIAVVNGGLNLAVAKGGPGTGNGVVGGAAAFVLGIIALALGGLALARCRRTALEPERMT